MKKILSLISLFIVSFLLGAGFTYAQNNELVEKKFYESYIKDSKEFIEKTKSLFNEYLNKALDKKEDVFSSPENPVESDRVKSLIEVLKGDRYPSNAYEAGVLYKAIPYDYSITEADEQFYFIYGVIISKVNNYYILSASEFSGSEDSYFKFRILGDNAVIYEVGDEIDIIGQLMRFQEFQIEDVVFEIPVFRAIFTNGIVQ